MQNLIMLMPLALISTHIACVETTKDNPQQEQAAKNFIMANAPKCQDFIKVALKDKADRYTLVTSPENTLSNLVLIEFSWSNSKENEEQKLNCYLKKINNNKFKGMNAKPQTALQW
jgi:hypothetical protein